MPWEIVNGNFVWREETAKPSKPAPAAKPAGAQPVETKPPIVQQPDWLNLYYKSIPPEMKQYSYEIMSQSDQDPTNWLGDWTWRKPYLDAQGKPLNNRGEPLPPGAIEWDANANASYGSGIWATIEKILWQSLTKKAVPGLPKEMLAFSTGASAKANIGGMEVGVRIPNLADTLRNIYQAGEAVANAPVGSLEMKLTKQKYPEGKTGVGGKAGNIPTPWAGEEYRTPASGEITRIIGESGQLIEGTKEGATPGPLMRSSRIASILIRAPATAISAFIDTTKDYAKWTQMGAFGTPQTVQELAKADGEQPISIEYIKEKYGNLEWMPEWVDYFLAAHPFVISYNTMLASRSPLSKTSQLKIIDEQMNASRIAFTYMVYPARKADFIARYQEGENPVFLEQEFGDPVAQMVGEMIIDPLNYVGGITRVLYDDYRLASEAAHIIRPSMEILELGPDAARLTMSVEDAVVADRFIDATIAASTRVKAGRAVLSHPTSQNPIKRLSQYVATGLRDIANKEVQTFARDVIVLAKGNADEVGRVMTGGAKMVGTDKVEVFDGILQLQDHELFQQFQSDAGRRFFLSMRELIGETKNGKLANGTKFLDELRELGVLTQSADELADAHHTSELITKIETYFTKKLGNLIDDTFPTVLERIKRHDKALHLQSQGEKLTRIQMADLQDSISRGDRFVAKFHEALQKGVGPFGYRPINQLASSIFMGYNWGYAMRNLMMDTVTSFFDYGFAMFKYYPGGAREYSRKMLGGVEPAYRAAIGPAGAADIGEYITSGSEFKKFIKGPGLWGTQKFEMFANDRIHAITIDKVMRKMMVPGRGLPDLTLLTDAGIPFDNARYLSSLVLKNYGDVNAAVKEYYAAVRVGNMNAIEVFAWLNAPEENGLQAFQLLDPIQREAARMKAAGGSIEDAQAFITKTFDDFRALGGKVSTEQYRIANNNPFFRVATELSAAGKEGEVSEAIIESAHNIFQSNINARYAWRQAVNKSIDGAIAELVKNGDPVLLNKYIAAANEVRGQLLQFDNALLDAGINQLQEELIEKFFNAKYVTKPPNSKFTHTAAWNDLIALGKKYDVVIEGGPPTTWRQFKNMFWEQTYYPASIKLAKTAKDDLITAAKAGKDVLESIYKPVNTNYKALFLSAEKELALNLWYEKLDDIRVARFPILEAIEAGNNERVALLYAKLYKIPTATEAGVPLNRKLLNAINQYAPEGTIRFERLADVDPEISRLALLEYARQDIKVPEIEDINSLLEMAEQGIKKPPRPYAGDMPTAWRVIHESDEYLAELAERTKRALEDNWNNSVTAYTNRTQQVAIREWTKQAKKGVAETRHLAVLEAGAARDFTLHAYPQKRGWDALAAYAFPYQYWYSRTYTKWAKRALLHPEVLSNYARTREFREQIHAGAPDWYKYQLNSDDIGWHLESPIWVNPEMSLFSLQGITGTDYNDPYKRQGWFATLVDDVSKFGPSPHILLQLAIATAFKLQGEDEISSHWGGRIFRQTADIKAVGALMNVKVPELDPAVLLFSEGGLTPTERNRASAALTKMVQDGVVVDGVQVTDEMAILAANLKSGPIWDEAVLRATKLRSLGQIASSFLGAGFKVRTTTDLDIDRFWTDYFRFMNVRPNLSPDEVKDGYAQLRKAYSFMDTLLIGRRTGEDSDAALAYNVLSRIPPGQRDNLFEYFKMDYETTVGRFYEDKGAIETWKEGDRKKFMDTIITLASILELPSDSTVQKWNSASSSYKAMTKQLKDTFGADIEDRIDVYFEFDTSNALGQIQARRYLAENPDVEDAMLFQDNAKLQDPNLAPYYASFEMLDRYYKSLLNSRLRSELGQDIALKQSAYYGIPDAAGRKQFLREHPELSKYWELRKEYLPLYQDALIRTASLLKEGADFNLQSNIPEGLGSEAEAAIKYMQQGAEPAPNNFTVEQWKYVLGSEPLWRVVQDSIFFDSPLSETAERELEYIADGLNIPIELLLNYIRQQLNMPIYQ